MKPKKIILTVLSVLAVLAVLTVPVKLQFKDGGSVSWTSLPYRVVKWYDWETDSTETKVYFIPDNFKDINQLREEYFAAKDK